MTEILERWRQEAWGGEAVLPEEAYNRPGIKHAAPACWLLWLCVLVSAFRDVRQGNPRELDGVEAWITLRDDAPEGEVAIRLVTMCDVLGLDVEQVRAHLARAIELRRVGYRRRWRPRRPQSAATGERGKHATGKGTSGSIT